MQCLALVVEWEEKTCKLCSNDTEDSKHFLFTCPTLAQPRELLRAALADIYGVDQNVMSLKDVDRVVKFSPNCDISKLAALSNCILDMLHFRNLHLLKK